MVLEFRSAQLSWSFVQQLATKTFPVAAILPARYCFVLPALLCCNVVFKVNLLRILLTYYPVCIWIFDSINIMPSSSKSPQAPSTKTHSFLRKSTDESPSFKTTSTSVPSEVRTSQSTNSLSPRSNESTHPEEDDVISDDEKPLKRELRLIFALVSAGGMIRIDQSMKIIQATFLELDLP